MSDTGWATMIVNAGVDFGFEVDVVEDDGSTIDLSSYTAEMVVASIGGAGTVFTLTSGSAEAGTPPSGGGLALSDGRIDVAITSDRTALLAPSGRYRYDLVVVSDADTPVATKILEGLVRVEGTLSL